MSKPASYFSRLRRSKRVPKTRDHSLVLRDEAIAATAQSAVPAGTTAAREPQLANEF